MRKISIIMYLGSAASLFMGLYKMFAYKNPESTYAERTNAYVGGDSYNYIINAGYATGYFVLFGSLLIAGVLIEILRTLKKHSNNN
jgi:hypothetical protein